MFYLLIITMLTVTGSDSFAQELARAMKADFIRLENRVFSEGEVCPRLECKPGPRVILAERMKAPISPNDYLVSTLLTLRNLKTMGAEHIDLVMPYFIYSRQDRVFRDGEPFSARHVLELLKEAGADRFFTVTSHACRDKASLDFSPIPSFNLDGFTPMANHIKNMSLSDPLVIAPDTSTEKSAVQVAKILETDHFTFEKTRDRVSGKVSMTGTPPSKGRDAVIVDDVTSSGSTLIKSAQLARKSGAKRILACVVHFPLGKELADKIQPHAWKVLSTNTIDSPVSEVSVVEAIADKLK